MIKPPAETASLNTTHLGMGVATTAQTSAAQWSLSQSLWSRVVSLSHVSFPHLSGTMPVPALLTGLAAAAIPATFLIISQPHTPNLRTAMTEPTRQYVASTSQATPTTDGTDTIAQQDTTQTAELAGAQLALSETDKAYQYHLSLADGYLRKAIRRSQETKDTVQTEAQKQEILALLEQALQAANQAVETIPDRGDAFLTRSHIYQVTSVIKPELAELAEQDRVIAEALGVSATAQNNNPLEYLPTQQAAGQSTAMIADPESGDDTTVTTSTADNATSGEVFIPAGESQTTITLTALTPDMKISVNNATDSTPVYVTERKNAETGSGSFAIRSSNPDHQGLMVQWYIYAP